MIHPRAIARERIRIDRRQAARVKDIGAEPQVSPEIRIGARDQDGNQHGRQRHRRHDGVADGRAATGRRGMHAQTVMVCPEKNQEGLPANVMGGRASHVRRMAHGLPLHECSLIADTRSTNASIRARFFRRHMQIRLARTTLAFVACTFLGVSLASAQASRTWVSGVGDDVNPCSRTAPCKTFAGAISKTAAGGEISVLDPGGFGTVTITKSITISGVGENASILGSTTNGININAGVNDVVTLHNIQINGFTNGLIGIRFVTGKALVLDDVRVFGFATGIQTEAGNTTINRSSFTNNRSFAIHALSNSTISVEDTMISTNNVAVQADGTGTVRLSNSSIYNNLTGFGCGGGTLASAGNNRKAGNVGGVVAVCSPTVAVTLQ